MSGYVAETPPSARTAGGCTTEARSTEWRPATSLANCPRCVSRLASEPHIIGAAASVGIEHGMSTPEMVQVYMLGLHNREGHAAKAAGK